MNPQPETLQPKPSTLNTKATVLPQQLVSILCSILRLCSHVVHPSCLAFDILSRTEALSRFNRNVDPSGNPVVTCKYRYKDCIINPKISSIIFKRLLQFTVSGLRVLGFPKCRVCFKTLRPQVVGFEPLARFGAKSALVTLGRLGPH